ncbi:DUF1343 domain-containing protein [Runella slithyformis]|uniref:Uncharacterized conserved protein UCP016719 n=1 Tax=Runella slithyformis (strain ATCC 29530 / DSM 19594 / LMG 11500 / NCIMB 11436 / LSU 4) TaxID=761193 RepID=A0A7U4E623_RUNSL|nr:DUF1343 domain-containing protein [Runella slithyformis]AEI48894.1 Uncharacterized conserved protein UCP016719 [Runella slithyformis DSM 19594]
MNPAESLSMLPDYLRTKKEAQVGLFCNQTAFVFEERKYLIELLAEAHVLHTVFVPEHGLFSELQDQEPVETVDAYRALAEKVQFISLYGQTEESILIPAQAVASLTDIVVDIQDVGCRYFTYTTSLAYLISTMAAMPSPPRLWVVDRANPAGRQVEGTALPAVYSSFIGHAGLPHRHGLSTGELARWLKRFYQGTFELTLVLPSSEDFFFQIFPSPNFPTLQTAQLYSGQCLFEATILSEGRGTTRPFEIIGAPFLSWDKLHRIKHEFELQTDALPWLNYILRPLQFIPTFHKYANELCGGFQIHLASGAVNHSLLNSLVLLRILNEHIPDLWRPGPYEKGNARTALEILVGDELLLEFVQGKETLKATIDYLKHHENQWIRSVEGVTGERLFSVLNHF